MPASPVPLPCMYCGSVHEISDEHAPWAGLVGIAYVSGMTDFLDAPTFIRKRGFFAMFLDDDTVGAPSLEDIELDMDVRASIHEFAPGPDGRCVAYLIRHGVRGAQCLSRDRFSVLHNDPEAEFRQMHDHNGGDCLCFEDDPRGYHGAMRDYAERQSSQTCRTCGAVIRAGHLDNCPPLTVQTRSCGCPIDYHLADCPITSDVFTSGYSPDWED